MGRNARQSSPAASQIIGATRREIVPQEGLSNYDEVIVVWVVAFTRPLNEGTKDFAQGVDLVFDTVGSETRERS
jgi:hypothetical protein